MGAEAEAGEGSKERKAEEKAGADRGYGSIITAGRRQNRMDGFCRADAGGFCHTCVAVREHSRGDEPGWCDGGRGRKGVGGLCDGPIRDVYAGAFYGVGIWPDECASLVFDGAIY